MLNIVNCQRNANQKYRGITAHWSERPSAKSIQTINAEEDTEKKEPSYTIGENGTATVENSMLPLLSQSCPTLCHPMDCNLTSSSIPGIFQARILKSVAISFSRGSPQLRY